MVIPILLAISEGYSTAKLGKCFRGEKDRERQGACSKGSSCGIKTVLTRSLSNFVICIAPNDHLCGLQRVL